MQSSKSSVRVSKPFAEIVSIYEKPLVEKDIITSYNISPQIITQAKAIQNFLTQDIDDIKNKLGLQDIAPITLPEEKAEELRQKIKSDKTWIKHYQDLVSLLTPDLDLTKAFDKIFLPWWNASQIGLISDKYSGENLNLNVAFSHSYLTQLIRRNQEGLKIDPVSISGVLITSDNLLVLGYRGGHTYSNCLMTTPAGSVEPHSEKNPLFESFYKELYEENKLNKKDLSQLKIMGRVRDHTLCEQSLYVFRAKTKLSLGELMEKWRTSEDKREHRYLVPFLNNPETFLEDLKENNYQTPKVAGLKVKTTYENVGTFVPPGAISILSHFVQQEGEQWAKNAQDFLGKDYKLVM